MFDIVSVCDPVVIDSDLVLPSNIIINDYSESLNIPVSYWSIGEYKKSWKRSIEEGLKRKTHSALITSMYDVESLNFIFTWVIYFDAASVHLQNTIIFVEEHENFTPLKINDYINSRALYNEDGQQLSKWDTDLLNFYEKL